MHKVCLLRIGALGNRRLAENIFSPQILHLPQTCDTIQVTETTQTEDFFHDLRYPEQPA